jgi:predicted dehydrogenase
MINFGVVGIEHPHAMNMVAGLLEAGATCSGYATADGGLTYRQFVERFPNLDPVDDPRRLIEDPAVDLIVSADEPARRADLAVVAMRAGKDVLLDKPGCTTLDQLDGIRRTVADTGRMWAVAFSERVHVRSAVHAGELVRAGAIGTVIQTVGLGPHRLKPQTRPDWFYDTARSGHILTDLASHQVDQFLYLTASTSAEVVASTVGNFTMPQRPGFEDFGELLLRSPHASGYVRVDWCTPDGLPTWGDGRLTILGTEGYIELRKYVDIAGRPGTDHLFLVDKAETRHVDCSQVRLPFYPDLIADVRTGTRTAMPQEHAFTATELAIRADLQATRLGHLR